MNGPVPASERPPKADPARSPVQVGATRPAGALTIQRSVGLELEHSVPIYRRQPGLTQEESLRQRTRVHHGSTRPRRAGPRAARTFRDHAERVEDQVRRNENGGQAGPAYYVGLPPGIGRDAARGYGGLGFQATVGVFPSQLDKLHRLAADEGLTDFNPRQAQRVISAIIDKHLEPVITQISDPIKELAKV